MDARGKEMYIDPARSAEKKYLGSKICLKFIQELRRITKNWVKHMGPNFVRFLTRKISPAQLLPPPDYKNTQPTRMCKLLNVGD